MQSFPRECALTSWQTKTIIPSPGRPRPVEGETMAGKSTDPKRTRITVRLSDTDLKALSGVARRRGVTVGVDEGYKGLIEGRLHPVDGRALDDAARRGGTLLGTARSLPFRTPEGNAKAREAIIRHEIKALVVFGGDGSLTGARTLLDAATH